MESTVETVEVEDSPVDDVDELFNESSNDAEESESKTKRDLPADFDEEVEKQRLNRLNFLLEKTSLYSNFLSQKLALAPQNNAAPDASEDSKDPDSNKKRKKGKSEVSQQPTKKKSKSEAEVKPESTGFKQSTLVSGGELRSYQLEGVEWLISLYENGLNGILADEMGLGKTVQCISLLAHLIENGVKGPFLIVGPLSTLANWFKEFGRWTPDIPVILYHGTKDERAEMRKNELKIQTKKSTKNNDKSITMLPVVITSYEIVMNDRKFLQKFKWKYIIVDEGHRLKNFDCKLIKELKSYQSANRLLLTGTPLQNNLTELWSLLNFLLPDIFDDLSSFQSWFDFSAINEQGGSALIIEKEQQNQIVTKLHQILRPFLLRRVKDDVELDIPKKLVKIVHTTLTQTQQKYYKATLDKQLNQVLSEKAIKALRNKGTGLQNMLMQLRKACNHPYLFEWPEDEEGSDLIDDQLIKSCGKMQILDRILAKMKKDGNKVLIFSQMTKMLDILEDYMDFRNYKYVRLDGSKDQKERQESIESFSTDDVFCFLLSTRAGGLGINLTAANIAIFYDNDWNPQMDLQAQDRCHRIGQTRPVQIYRFATINSVESRILERADNKLKLDRLVIQKGNFTGVKSKSSITEISELESLLKESPENAGVGKEVTDEFLFQWDNLDNNDEKKVVV